MEKARLLSLTSMCYHRAKEHNHKQVQDHCISFLVMPAALIDSVCLLSVISPSGAKKACS